MLSMVSVHKFFIEILQLSSNSYCRKTSVLIRRDSTLLFPLFKPCGRESHVFLKNSGFLHRSSFKYQLWQLSQMTANPFFFFLLPINLLYQTSSSATKLLIFYRIVPHTLCFSSWMLWHQNTEKKKKKPRKTTQTNKQTNKTSPQIKNKVSNIKLLRQKHTHVSSVYQYLKLISEHYVILLAVLHRLLADENAVFCEFVIPLENIRSLGGITSAVHRKIPVITNNFFYTLLSESAHPQYPFPNQASMWLSCIPSVDRIIYCVQNLY